MRNNIFFIFCLLLFPASFMASAAAAEDVEKLTLRNALEQALRNNLNLQLRREDVNSAEGATQIAVGKFDVIFEAEAQAQQEELTPIFFGGAEQEESGLWRAAASKVFSPGTSISLGWNNSTFTSDVIGLQLDPSRPVGAQLAEHRP